MFILDRYDAMNQAMQETKDQELIRLKKMEISSMKDRIRQSKEGGCPRHEFRWMCCGSHETYYECIHCGKECTASELPEGSK